LNPFLKAVDLQPASRNLFRGALRLLLVLLHDFPEFLSEYYFSICDVIPPRCIQLRNVVLSAFPPKLRLPDPHLRDLDLDTLPEMGPIPPFLSDFTAALSGGDLRDSLDKYLLNRGSVAFLNALKDSLLSPRYLVDSSSEKYNLPLINALVMYVGVSSVAQAKARSGSSLFVPTDPGVTLLLRLASDMDAEGR
jgi:CCR4-NOT transcription complex subunit 1